MCFGGATLLPRVIAVADSNRILLGQVLSGLARRGQNWSFAPRDRISLLGSCCLLSLNTVSLLASASATISRYRCKLTLMERHLSRVIVVLVGQHRRYFSTTTAHFLTLRFLLRIRIIQVKVWDQSRLAILVHRWPYRLLILVGRVLILNVCSLPRCGCDLSSLIPIIARGLQLDDPLLEYFLFSDQFLHLKIRVMACEILHHLQTLP